MTKGRFAVISKGFGYFSNEVTQRHELNEDWLYKQTFMFITVIHLVSFMFELMLMLELESNYEIEFCIYIFEINIIAKYILNRLVMICFCIFFKSHLSLDF